MNPAWQNITDPVFHWAAERPQAPALIQGPQTLTYAELAALVGKAAVHLDGSGFRAGDRVAINLTNSIDHFILTLGLLRLGVTTMEIPYNTRQPPEPELLATHAIRTVFIEPAATPVAGFPSIKLDAGWRGAIAQQRGDRRCSDNGDGIFIIVLTSGTTGMPKGGLTSHRQYFEGVRAQAAFFADRGVFSSERPANLLLAASVGFGAFLRRVVRQLFIGGPTTILPEYQHTIDLVKAIGAWDEAVCYVTSAVCRYLISCAPQQGVLYPRLRALIGAGSLLYPEEKLAVLARVSPNFYDSYGAEPFGMVAMLSPQEMRERPASVGRPPSFVEVQVVDESGRTLPPGSVGRLRCRGTKGHTFIADLAAGGSKVFSHGWFYPGDYAHLDDAGYIYLKGRSVDVINRDGVALYATEIEAAVALHPSVAEVAVVGVPRAVPGDELVALVVPRGQAQHEALALHCRNLLPRQSWPDRVFYAQALPKTAAGKIDHARVRAIIMAEIHR